MTEFRYRQLRWQDKAKAAGLCTHCGKKPARGYRTCAKRRKWNKARQWRRKSHG